MGTYDWRKSSSNPSLVRTPKGRTKRLVLPISQVVVGNCREFEVVITDQQLVINEKQTWCLPADHIWRFEPRAGISTTIFCVARVTIICDGYSSLQMLGFPVCGVVSCSPADNTTEAGPCRFFAGSPGAGVARVRSSGELADENGPAAPREVALILLAAQ